MSDESDYYGPPEGTDIESEKPDNENWLATELEKELEDAAPEPEDIDSNGNVTDTEKLATVAAKLFYKGRKSYNF
jgi:hypothetical protein